MTVSRITGLETEGARHEIRIEAWRGSTPRGVRLRKSYYWVCSCGERGDMFEHGRDRAAAEADGDGHAAAGTGSGVVYIARCPDHGLHGGRRGCYECGRPVERVPMVPVSERDLLQARVETLERALEDLIDRQHDFPTDLSRNPQLWYQAWDRARAALEGSGDEAPG